MRSLKMNAILQLSSTKYRDGDSDGAHTRRRLGTMELKCTTFYQEIRNRISESI